MALNLFGGRTSAVAPGAPESESAPPPAGEDASDARASTAAPRRRATRRGSRGRGGSTKQTTTETAKEEPAKAEAPKADEAPARSTRRRRTTAAKAEPSAEQEPDAAEPKPARSRARAKPAATDTGTEALLAAVKEQNEKLTKLIEMQEGANRAAAGAAIAVLPRVGIFIDSANVELGADRTRKRIDWTRVLETLTEGRRLVRAVAYSPVHDDPDVSPETQRFVEPFLGKGVKIVTKPLKRFADGSIKANVDIELAVDLLTMCDRLDVAVLVSGDGDFQRLVEVVQARGVRVEVAGVGSSVAAGLRNVADRYIELETGSR